jgi:hypothetical protein
VLAVNAHLDGDALLEAAARLAWRDDDAQPRTYGRLAFDAGSRQWIITELEPQVAIRAKRIFPRVASTQVGSYTFADSDEARTELQWFIARYPLMVTPEDRQRLADGSVRFARIRAEIEQVLQEGWIASDAPKLLQPGKALRPNQARAAEVARRLGRLLIADSVGLGKTLSALATIMDERFLPAAILCEVHVASQWQKKFIEGFTTLSSHVVQKAAFYVLPNVDCYIIAYSKAYGWADIAATGRFRSVIFDEVQNLRHGLDTERGRSAKVFADHAAMRIALSATPVFGYGGEMFNICNIIEPGILGAREEFVREWCVTDDEHKLIVKDPAALGAHLRDINFILREVGKGPPPNRIVIDVPYDEEAVASSEELARSLAMRVLSGRFTERGQAARELDMMLRHDTGVAKAKHVAAYCKLLLDAGTPIILGGWHRDVYDIWLDELKDYHPLMYTGSETPRQKEAAAKSFMEGDSNLIIMSLRSGAGLDGLQHRCRTVVHGELDWSHEVHKQLAGRLRPHDRDEPIDEIYILTDGGSDPVIAAVQGLKASQAHGIIDPKLGVQAVHSDESRIKELAKAYLEKGR